MTSTKPKEKLFNYNKMRKKDSVSPHPTNAHTVIHKLCYIVLLVLVAGFTACQTDVMETPPQRATTPTKTASTATAPTTASSEPEKAEPEHVFDPQQACLEIDTLTATAFPAAEFSAAFPKRNAETPDLELTAKSGWMEIRENIAILHLANDALAECSPFLEKGGVPSGAELSITLGPLEQETLYRFSAAKENPPPPAPESVEGQPAPVETMKTGTISRWSYRYTTAEDYPFTIRGKKELDPGIVVIEQVDDDKKTVSGKLLLCRGQGKLGIALGSFDVPLCTFRPPPTTEPPQTP